VLIDRVRQQAGSYGSVSDQTQAGVTGTALTPPFCPVPQAAHGQSSVGAGLLANAVGQSLNSVLIDRVRQQAGSYGSVSNQTQAGVTGTALTPRFCPIPQPAHGQPAMHPARR